MPVKAPDERCPLWSAPLGPQAASTRGLSTTKLATRALLAFLSTFGPIGILRRKRDSAFAQQPGQQAHRHPDDVVVGPADRFDQPAALALYSVGTSLILRFTAPNVVLDHARRKFTHSDVGPLDAVGLAPRALVEQMDRGVDCMAAPRRGPEERRGRATVRRFPIDAATAHYLGIGRDDHRAGKSPGHRAGFCLRRPGHEAERSERLRRAAIHC